MKYLHRLACDQAQAPEPLFAAAILTFHDAIELFLQLASERLNVGAKRLDFMQYFDHIEPTLGQALSQREAMRRLNSARIALKHHGTLPAKREVVGFGAAVDDFFGSNTPTVFGVEFAAISLSTLIVDTEVRTCLERADECIADGNAHDAVASIAEAFARLLYAYHVRSGSSRDLDSASRELDHAIKSVYARGPAGKMAKVVEALGEEVALLRHGVDTRRLTVFRALTPHVAISMAGTPHFAWTHDAKDTKPDAVRFCYDFVIDSALRIQHIHSLVDELGIDRYMRSEFGPL